MWAKLLRPTGAQASTNLSLRQGICVSCRPKKRTGEETDKSETLAYKDMKLYGQQTEIIKSFMSAQIRKRIETLLRGEVVQWEDNFQLTDDNDYDDLDNDLKAYVVERLHSEGFSKTQAVNIICDSIETVSFS